ncbi:DNA-processing protein DprA [Treponema pedis]|uniref:DNA-processing protein DprA n=1 Tax=Treponema pedis TaxID=409322 RepID=UPI000414BFE4|nr:DNA-processing protein DprA [Treponema pedis]
MKISDKEILNIALSQCSFLRGREKLLLSEKLDGIEEFSLLSIKDISELIGRRVNPKKFEPELIQRYSEKAVKIMEMYGISSVSFNEKDFPPLLREIPDAPFMIFYRGVLPNPELPAIAMVGTRRPTGEGIQEALSLGREFAELGIPVVSGLAYGIDTYSHRGCFEAEVKRVSAVAVLACGPEGIYPKSNKKLAAKILEEGGCILSEYTPGTEPLAFRFPERNRIISGLSRSVLIVEAPKKSGALITGEFALEQGRDVYVCKTLLNSIQNEGCVNLAEQGALAITSAKDILNDWKYSLNENNRQVSLFTDLKL